MRNFIYILFSLLLVFLVSCSNNDQSKKEEGNKKAKETVNVDKGLLSVKITLPASMFKDQNIDTVIADAEKKGIKVTKNEDGSLTYKMSKAQHREMMAEMKKNIDKTIQDTKNGKDFVSIKDITHNDSFTEFTLLVDKAAYQNSFDGFASLGLGFSGMMYQLFNGANPDTYKVTIYVKDQATQEVFDQTVYPDALNDASK